MATFSLSTNHHKLSANKKLCSFDNGSFHNIDRSKFDLHLVIFLHLCRLHHTYTAVISIRLEIIIDKIWQNGESKICIFQAFNHWFINANFEIRLLRNVQNTTTFWPFPASTKYLGAPIHLDVK